MIELTSVEQFDGLNGKNRFIVWFTAAWCGPCQRMDKAYLEDAAKTKKLQIYYSDETVNPELATRYGIARYPTFCLFSGGECVSTRTSSDATSIMMWIKRL
jgi:thiol-disulfide isomerase/thioredoxin